MKPTRWWPIPVLLLAAFALLNVACGGLRQAARNVNAPDEDLEAIGSVYEQYCTDHNQGPANVDVLIKDFPDNKTELLKVKNGTYVLIWGVYLNDPIQFQEIGKSKTVLGYEANVPTMGGEVLTCDGLVDHKTAAEFRAMPKAKSGGGLRKEK
jgi:hypothetical protein